MRAGSPRHGRAGAPGALHRGEGHTSKDEPEVLALAHAKAVFVALVKRGVAADRMETRSFGASRPRNDASTAELRKENRRVELTVVDDGSRSP